MKKTTALLLLICAWPLAYAQTGCSLKISGRLLNPTDSAGIPHAEIFIENGHLLTRSDANGYFKLTGVCPGQHLLELDKRGFEHRHDWINILSDTSITLMMWPAGLSQDTVTIHASREKSAMLQLTGAAIHRQTGSDLSRIAASIPGIQVIQGGRNQAKPMARGMYGLRLPIFTDQFKLEGQQWGNDHNPEADARNFDRIELIKDASMLRYSHDGPGGVLLLSHAPEVHDGESNLDQYVQLSSNGGEGAYSAHFTRKPRAGAPIIYSHLNARRAGNYSIPGHILDNTALAEYSAGLGIIRERNNDKHHLDISGYHFEGGIFSGSRASSINDLRDAINRAEPITSDQFSYKTGSPRQVVDHAGIQYQFARQQSDYRNEWSAGLQYDQRREFDFHRNSSITFPQLDLLTLAPAFRFQQTRQMKTGGTLSWGTQWSGHIHRYGGYYFLPVFNGLAAGTYGIYHWHKRKQSGTLALRGDARGFSADVKSGGIVSRMNRSFMNYSLAYTGMLEWNKHTWHWHLARTWRAPWLNELYSQGVHHGAASFEQGNKLLGTEKSYRAELEWQYHATRGNLYLSPYINFLPGFINLSPMNQPVLTVRGAFPGYLYTQNDALFTGLDASMQLNLNKSWAWQGRLSLLYARYMHSGRYPAFIPPAKVQNVVTRNGKKWSLRIEHEFNARQIFYEQGSDLLPPPPAYSLWHLEAGTNPDRKSARWDFSAGVTNVFNTAYRSYLDRFRYFTDMPGRNIYVKGIYRIHHHTENH